LPLRLTPPQWRALLRWFVRGVPSADIARETRLERKRVLRALAVVRLAMMRSFPAHVRRGVTAKLPPLARTVRRHRGHPQRPTKVSPRGAATLGLYVAHGREWVDIIPASDAEALSRTLRGGQLIDRALSGGFERYAAVVYRGRLYRLPESAAGRPAIPFGRIEAFWAYLQRQLRAKGGIRRERLALYLAEYVWRYHHPHVPPAEQLRKLLTLISQHPMKWTE
jgi:hypothetical protein